MNRLKFKAALAEADITQQKLCKMLGMAESTMIRKIKHSSFTVQEAKAIMQATKMADPIGVFFTD